MLRCFGLSGALLLALTPTAWAGSVPIPEPASIGLFAAVAGVVAAAKFRKRK